MREIHATTLDQIAFFDQAGNAASSGRTRPTITAEGVAMDQRISRRRLDQLMLQSFGHSIASHLWSRRLEQAAVDLRDPSRANQSIAQIAFANGFEDAAHFTRAFKRRFSQTPRQWRAD